MKMRLLVAFSLAFGAFSATAAEIHVLSANFIDSINQKQSSWTAGKNFPENTTDEYLRKLSGFISVHPDPNYKPKTVVHSFSSVDIPESYDVRTRYSACDSVNRIRDQGACASSWAFAAVESMSDRLCIFSPGVTNFIFSPEDLLSCCTNCGNCSAGYMIQAFQFWIQNGVVSGGDVDSNEGCMPYTADAHDDGIIPACTRSCRDGYSYDYTADKHYGSYAYGVINAADQMQYEILTNGPIIVNFELFQDLYNYQTGVYSHVSGDSVGYHVVKMIGWGVENDLPYWLIANSWGTSWGDQGFFKMARGQNECGIESNPTAAMPNRNPVPNFKVAN